ncbi:MAG: hypothetical protein WCI63_01160 [bacterium]
MIIGFSTGCLYKTHDALDPATIDLFRRNDCSAVEIMVHRVSDIDKLIALKPSDLLGFEYISLHAPIYDGSKKEEYINALRAIERIHTVVRFNTVVLHPDLFDEFTFLKDINLPFAIENMDNRKKTCKSVESLQQVFKEFDVPMIIDINHSFSNDPTMKLSEDLVKAFHSKIEEVHLSGFDTFHDPLFKTQQQVILDAIPSISLPVIIESVLDSVGDIETELEYIKKNIKKF